MADRRARAIEAKKDLNRALQQGADATGRQITYEISKEEEKRQINLILEEMSEADARRLGYFHKTKKVIELNQLGIAYAGIVTQDKQQSVPQAQPGPSSAQPGPSSRARQQYAYELASSTSTGPAYPTGPEAELAIDHLRLNYEQDSLIRAGYMDLTNSTAGGTQLRLLWAGLDKYRADMKMVVPSTHPKFLVATEYAKKNFPNPMYMFDTLYEGKIYKALTTEGLKKYEEAEKSAAASAQAERIRLSEVVPKPSKDYETAIKKSLEDWEKQLIEYLNQLKTQKLTLQSIESLSNIVSGIIDYLTKVLSDEIAFDTTVGADLRLYLDNLIQKGVNEKLYKMLRMVMNQCIIPPLPRGKKYGDFDVGTQNLYDIAYNLYRFVLAYLPLSQKLPYVKLGNIEETMKNWKIWYDDQDDPDDAQYKGLDISGYIIKNGTFPTTLNVQTGQAVEQEQSYGTTYRINFYYPNPWEASGTIKYFDVVLA